MNRILIGIFGVSLVAGVGCSRALDPMPFDEAVWKAGEDVPFDSNAPRLFKEYALVYWLGAERGFIRIDSEWLVVNFDKNNRVSDALMVRD